MLSTIKNTKIKKIVIIILIISLTFSNWYVLGEWAISKASSSELQLQTDTTKEQNVKFNIGFEKENEIVYQTISDVNELINLKTYISVENEGYLKDTCISFSGENNESKNFEILEIRQQNNIIKSSSANEITLNQISNGETINLELIAKLNNEIKMNTNKLNQNNIVKLTSTYVNSDGKESKIEKSIILNITWTCENEITLNSKISRYTQYELLEEKGTIITQTIEINQNNSEALPYKNIEINAMQIKINEKLADEIIVKQENKNIEFKTLEGETIQIIDENKEEESIVKNTETTKKYNITYIFKNAQEQENIEINTKIEAEAQIYSATTPKTAELEYKETLTEKVGNIVEIENNNIGSISKGKIYANYNQNNPEYVTTYESNININISYKQKIKQINLTNTGTYFEDVNENKYNLQDTTKEYTYFTSTKINKEDVEKILGTEGIIKIYDSKNNQIGEINENTNIDENGYYNIEYTTEPSNISIITSEIIGEGNIEIINTKAIKPNLPYTKAQVQEFKILEDEYKLDLGLENNETISIQSTLVKNELQESTTEAIFNFNTNNFSSISENENIEIKIELKNNRQTSDLYKNPVFEIEFPKEITQINIKDANILFDEELQIESLEQTIRNEKIILTLKLKGTQTKFLLDEYINGTTIIINADIKVDVATSSKTEKVVMKYYNENAISYNTENYGEYVNNIEFISPIGMIIGTEISNYNIDNQTIMSVLQGEQTGKLEIFTEAKNAQTNILVVNNTKNNCDELVILGRLPFKGNKNILTAEDLGTTIDTKLTSPIAVDSKFENIEIYYSNNGEATTDLTLPENNWTTDITSFENIKTFIVKINQTVSQSDVINIKYNFEIPANLEHNTYLYQDVVAFYNNNREIAQVEETSQADLMCLTTGRGPQMEVTQTASIQNGEEVSEGQKIRYTITVKNTGIDPIYNLEIKDILPDNAIYTVYTRNGLSVGYDEKDPDAKVLIWNIEELGIEQNVEVQFDVEVNKLPSIEEYYSQYNNLVEDNGKYYLKENETLIELTEIPTIYMTNKVAVNAKDLAKEILAEDYSNIVKSPEIFVTEVSSKAEEVLMRENENLTYTIRVKNNKQEDITNINISKIIPEGVEFKEIYSIKYNEEYEEWEKQIIGTYNSQTREASINVGTISENSDVHIKIEVQTSKLAEEEYNKEFETITKITGNNIGQYTGNTMKNTIAKPKLITEYICDNNNKYINNGEIIEYSIKVTNVSNISANNVKINDVLPEGLDLIKAEYSVGDFSITTSMNKNREIEATGNLLPNETMTLNIKAKAVSKSQNISIENTATINSQELGNKQTETVTHIIESVSQTGTITMQQEERKYSITGKVWYDQNRNGIRDVGEIAISNTELLVINADTGVVVQRVTNDSDGNYYINDLSKGNYLVIAKYDEEKYQVTEYKKIGALETNNSDVIAVDIQENGTTYKGAISDTIRIENSDSSNIDIGLSDKLIFDFNLESQINKITTQNEKEIKEYNYENTNFAKIDIDPDLLNSTIVYVEYKILIKNEGNVAGLANNIINYKPQDMEFNSELNPNWYIGQDGNLYSNELANQTINPGETKEINLILIKKMTETNTGINLNTVEIYETYNEFGLQDIDSKENNKSDTEDDYSQTTALISIQLGKTVFYNLSIIFIILVAIFIGLCYIKGNKILTIKPNKKKYK